MFTTIGAVLDGPKAGPGCPPVRRGSHMSGRCEAVFWRPTSRQEVRRICLAARRYELVGRGAGQRNGPLGHVALEVLDYLGHLVSFRTGRLEPSLAWLMQKLRRSRDAIVRALDALRRHGFLDWLRRFEPTGCEGRGPQVRQVSNAYRLALPPRAARLLGIHGQDVPLPDDLAHAQEARRAEVAAFKATLALDELAVLEVDDGPLAKALAGLGRLVQERESARQTESRTSILT